MRSLGLDVGDKRTGVAISDPEGLLAVPLTVITKSEDAAIDDIIQLVEQYGIERIVVGLPRSLNGILSSQADKVKAFVEKLLATSRRSNLDVDIQLWDEWFSTVAADCLIAEAGTKRSKRNQHRDAIAAAFILQGFLDRCHLELPPCYSERNEETG